MKNLGSNTATIIKLVKQALGGLAIPSPSAGSGVTSTPYSTSPPRYVFIGEETANVFVYGISQYGGDDVVLSEDTTRNSKRYFLTIRGDEQ